MKKKVALHNLGCKVNAYEVEAMQQLLENAGYETVPFEEGADVYVINTCTVTNIADRKSRQMLHKAKKMNPDAIVVATGCYAQADTEKLKEDGIDAEIVNIHTIKPIDRELVIASAKKTGKVVTAEEHSVIGGLGSAVAEVLSEEAPTKLLRIGVGDVFGESGPAKELVAKYGLDGTGIYEKVKKFVK